MPPAARVGDMHVCPMVTGVVPHVGGPILPPGCPTVLIGNMPAARVGDMATCVGPPDVIAMGSPTVLIGNMMAARIGDMTAHGGAITVGFPTVMIGMSGMGKAGGAAGASAAMAAAGTGAAANAAEATAQKDALMSAAQSGMPFVQQCVKASASPPPRAKPAPSQEPAEPPGPQATPGGGASADAGASGAGATGGDAATAPTEATTAAADAADAATHPPDTETTTTWIGIELVNEQGEPVANEPYEIMFPNGDLRPGKLDGTGRVRLDNIDPGQYLVSFPKLNERKKN